jgi:hypothetical protein
MTIPFVIDNQQHRMADALNELLTQSVGKPLDIATAYFAISGYRLVKEGLHQVGAFRLVLGAEPHTGVDFGLKPNAEALMKRLQGDLEAEPFTEATLKLVEELIAFLQADKVEVRLYDRLFTRPDPGADGDLYADLNPNSETVLQECLVEPALTELPVGETVQFERLGYFCPDPDSTPGRLVFNRTLGLRDTWAKLQAQAARP